jgi:hypothetical protein
MGRNGAISFDLWWGRLDGRDWVITFSFWVSIFQDSQQHCASTFGMLYLTSFSPTADDFCSSQVFEAIIRQRQVSKKAGPELILLLADDLSYFLQI